ncbi:hypothetical protein CJ305_16100 [Leeuwenhoekiella nanhaiensis]|uniref:Uncharacterized protein n=1 Tax=Leeuwenhoekiella nanhaiensis TaxID=1655491 RepID=A0A2G1VN22_9FLAO|nr:hypothetical protein CJ305_16100 [Leeuwenhoekiella nanhaiensis]
MLKNFCKNTNTLPLRLTELQKAQKINQEFSTEVLCSLKYDFIFAAALARYLSSVGRATD